MSILITFSVLLLIFGVVDVRFSFDFDFDVVDFGVGVDFGFDCDVGFGLDFCFGFDFDV